MGRGHPISVCGDRHMETLAATRSVRAGDLLKESPQIAPFSLTAAQRRRTGYPRGAAGAAGVHLRGPLDPARPGAPLDPARPGAPTAPVPLSPAAARLQHPRQPGYSKRLRAARGLILHRARALAASTRCPAGGRPAAPGRDREASPGRTRPSAAGGTGPVSPVSRLCHPYWRVAAAFVPIPAS
jgi:hypothetical protein